MISRLALALALAFAAPSQAQQAGMPEIESVIRDQMTAFQADDWTGAFTYASPGIRSIFRTPEIFGQMVREGYPMVWRPGAIRFGALDERGGRQLQRVVVTDAQGVPHVLEYEMIPGPDGWKINGVRLLEAPKAGA